MKRFRFVHDIFGTDVEHDETNLPPWLTHKANKWFLDGYVMKLEVGGVVQTDFHTITRIA